MSNQDLLEQIYYLIDESIPSKRYPDPAEQALYATFTPEQQTLFDEYIMEEAGREDAERIRLFCRLIRFGLYLQSL